MIKKIENPKIHTVVYHTGWGKEDNTNYPCDVLITDGNFLSNGRVSNFWRWKRILPDGTISEKEESGFGDFEQSDKEYSVEIIVKEISSKS